MTVLVQRFLLVLMCAGFVAATARAGEPTVGAITGMVTDRAGTPVAHATVTAVRADGGAIRATVSGSDGVYSSADGPAV